MTIEFKLGDIAAILNGTVEGDSQAKVSALAKIQEGKPGSISFLSNPKYEQFIYTTEATAVVVNKDFKPKEPLKCALIKVDDAYTGFTLLLEQYQRFLNFSKVGIEQPAHIGKNSTHGDALYLGAFAYLGENVSIGDNVKIYPQVYIGDNVTIGDNTIIYSGAKIYRDCKIGKHCTIQSGAIIGSDGFGFAPQSDGTYKTIPQLGNVILEDHVDIGANTVIDCATMGSTVIHSGVKLDNLIQIAHNVEIGKNTVIAAQAGVSGSTSIGDNCMIGGQVGLSGHISLANHTKVGAQSGIGNNITQEGLTLQGSPAYDIKAYWRSMVVFRKLPEVMRRIEELEGKFKTESKSV